MVDGERPTQAQREFAERLFREHGPRLRRIAQRNSMNSDDAEEALQRTMETALRADPEMPGNPLAWATTVVKREAWSIHRKRTHRIQRPIPGREESQDLLEGLEAQTPGPEEAAERSELVRAFRQAFDSLKPQERTILLLIGAGLTYQEIQEKMGFTHTKINRCVSEGRATLRERMSAWEREGSAALDDLYSLQTLEREPTQTLLRRRETLIAARRAETRRSDDLRRRGQWRGRLQGRLEAVRARRLALETTPDTPWGALLGARTREREARETLMRFGQRRGGTHPQQRNRASREEVLVAIDAELARRREMVLNHAIRHEPGYVREAFGPRPDQMRGRIAWCGAVDRLVALRQVHGITDSDRAIGKQPTEELKTRLGRLRSLLVREPPAIQPTQQQSGPELAL